MLFSNIHVLVGVIGRNTATIADMDPGSVALNGLAERICWKDRTFLQEPLLSRTFKYQVTPLRYLIFT